MAVRAPDHALRYLLGDARPRRPTRDERAHELALLADVIEVEDLDLLLPAIDARMVRQIRGDAGARSGGSLCPRCGRLAEVRRAPPGEVIAKACAAPVL